eukprot:2390886-Amphidinium_carterae.1
MLADHVNIKTLHKKGEPWPCYKTVVNHTSQSLPFGSAAQVLHAPYHARYILHARIPRFFG